MKAAPTRANMSRRLSARKKACSPLSMTQGPAMKKGSAKDSPTRRPPMENALIGPGPGARRRRG